MSLWLGMDSSWHTREHAGPPVNLLVPLLWPSQSPQDNKRAETQSRGKTAGPTPSTHFSCTVSKPIPCVRKDEERMGCDDGQNPEHGTRPPRLHGENDERRVKASSPQQNKY